MMKQNALEMKKNNTALLWQWEQNSQTLAWAKEQLAIASGLQQLRLQLLQNDLLRYRKRLSDQLVVKGGNALVPEQISAA